MIDFIKIWVDYIAAALELLGVLIIIGGSLIALVKHLPALRDPQSYKSLREELGKVILLGLEILVGADIIGTVTADATLQNVMILGLIVLIRTFLSFSIELEINGKLPWK